MRRLLRSLGDLTLARRIQLAVGVVALLTIALAAMGALGLRVISGLRALDAARGHWRHSTLEACDHLARAARTLDAADLEKARWALDVPIAVHDVHVEWRKPDADYEGRLVPALERAKVPPSDARALLWTVGSLGGLSQIQAIEARWDAADGSTMRLVVLADAVERDMRAPPSAERDAALAAKAAEVQRLAVDLASNGEPVARSVDAAIARIESMFLWLLLGGTALVVGVSTALTLAIGRRVRADIAAIAAGARRVADGDLTARLDPRARDELGALAAEFDRMAERLAAARAGLERAKAELEARVVERTYDLARSEQRWRDMIEGLPHGHYVAARDGALSRANPALARMLGCASGEEAARLHLARDVEVEPEGRERAIERLEPEGAGAAAAREAEWRRRDGRRIRVRVVERAAERDASGKVVSLEGVVEEVTEVRRLEERLRRTHRMEAVGLLAGGVAHDFNNSLTAILGSAVLLARRAAPDTAERRGAETIRKAAERATAVTRMLLAFSKNQVLKPSVLEPNQLVQALVVPLRRLLGDERELTLDLAPDLGRVVADPALLEQALVGLVAFARDATRGRGRVVLSTANADVSAAEAADHAGASAGPHVVIAVEDQGEGLSPEAQSRLFEPYFAPGDTARGVEAGGGLGLSAIYGTVVQSGGHVRVRSEAGRGTRISIYLPRSGAAPTPLPGEGSGGRGGEKPGKGAAVLVVEDDDEVRSVVSAALADAGFDVAAARSGAEALDLWRARQGALDLVLTDLSMPGMTGRQLSERLRAERATLRVLYMSGRGTEALRRGDLAEKGASVIAKPFTPDALVRAVREALERS